MIVNSIPKISVVMSVLNGQNHIRQAIESILNQSFTDFEFIIINDGSTDDTLSIVKSYSDIRLKVVDQENMGLATSLNNGIKIAKGEYIARMDADDFCDPKRLEKQIMFLDTHNEYVIVGSNAIIIDEIGRELYKTNLPNDDKTIKTQLEHGCPFYHGSVVIRREALLQAGLYHDEIKHWIEDDLLWIDLKDKGLFHILDDFLYYYRFSTTSISLLTKSQRRKLKEIINNYSKNRMLSSNEIEFVNNTENMINSKLKSKLYHHEVGRSKLMAGSDKIGARMFLVESLKLFPLDYKIMFYLILSFMPDKLLRAWMHFRNS